ncbi:VRR-NUC domain-containing protein [Lederbergia sp. NSJ-179]|uniref:VRR-NUC domain-containing protein n=1 Tax=Lederbergia sp. NSJ-179 TaxID=2931402 RepID=UPI001FD0AD91|nr:VRR-NUC domain-containing protein [Lederbergia sp. NSJ-179]MCJ7839963.1 VRR-NUC domain-containing protein [Lederbergia sp. NSJ-179]
MKESQLEKRLKDKIEKLGGLCFKWVSPGRRGVPDRICILPKGRIIFVEMKAPNGRLSPLQRKRIDELRVRGQEVYVLHTRKKVDDFIEMVGGEAQ